MQNAARVRVSACAWMHRRRHPRPKLRGTKAARGGYGPRRSTAEQCGREDARGALARCALVGALCLPACVTHVHLSPRPSPDECRMANEALGDRTAAVTTPSGYTIHRDKAGVVRVDPDGVSSTIDGSRLAWSSVASISTVSHRRSMDAGAAVGATLGFAATFLTVFTMAQNQGSR